MTPASAGSPEGQDTAGGLIGEADDIAVGRKADAPNSSDINQIAKGLSDAQRDVMQQPMSMSTHRFYAARHHRTCRALVADGLLAESSDGVGNPMFGYTDLGLQVRTHLLVFKGLPND